MNTNKYSLESRREQANLYKTWGIILLVIGFGLFLYAGAKMIFEPQIQLVLELLNGMISLMPCKAIDSQWNMLFQSLR